jgi:hypothetical protein
MGIDRSWSSMSWTALASRDLSQSTVSSEETTTGDGGDGNEVAGTLVGANLAVR